MGSQLEVIKDQEGNSHIIFDKSALYDDSQMGESLKDFEILRVLGSFEGGKNFVSKVRSLKNNKIYAMKRIDLNDIKKEEEKKLCLDQMEKLKALNHPHLIKYYKTFIDDKNNLYLVYEYMNNSDLQSFIKAHQILEKLIKEEVIWNILLQCLSGLDYLHKENLGHLAIKLTNIFLNNEQNVKIGLFYKTPKLDDKNYDIKKDILNLGLFFYKMCFSSELINSKWIDDIGVEYNKQSDDYSDDLLEIVYKMIEEDPSKRLSARELYDLVKEKYVKKFTNNTSIKAVLRCLYSYPKFSQSILNNEQNIISNKEKYYINFWYLNTIKAISSNSNLNKCLEEFRRALASENSKLDCSKEVDPIYLLAFLLEKMHKEDNKIKKTEIKTKSCDDQYVINSIYKVEEEDRTNKEQMIQKFTSYFKKNVNSIISNLFFGFIKTKRICRVCRSPTYLFSNNCFIAFDLNRCTKDNFDLVIDGFYAIHKENRILPKEKYHVFCDKCLTEQNHNEFNRYYSMGEHLIICLYRGNSYQNNINVTFKEELILEVNTERNNKKVKIDLVENKDSPSKFYLVGSVNRVLNNGKEEFQYFSRDPNNKNFWYTSQGDGNFDTPPIGLIEKAGKVVMLFYNAIK